MVTMRSTSLLLGLLLVCAIFKDSLTLAHQGAVTTSNGNEYVETKEDATPINQGLPSDTIVTHSQETRIKGRKMVKDEGVNVESNKLSYRSLLHMKVKVVGLFPFSADYYVPRPHPPKNN